MKRFFGVFVAFVVLFSSLGITRARAADACPSPETILDKLFKQPGNNRFTILQQVSLDGDLCAAVAKQTGTFQPRLFIYTKDGRYAFFGTVVQTADMKPWGQDLVAKYSKLEPGVVANLESLAIHVGTSKTRVIMITDPLCPFCKQIVQALKPFVAKNQIGLDIIFEAMHKGSHRVASHLLCAKHTDFITDYLDAPKLLDAGSAKALTTCSLGTTILGEMGGALQTVGVTSTPTFVLERNNEVITGVVPVQALLSKASGKPLVMPAAPSRGASANRPAQTVGKALDTGK